jgi:hypothetical protein
MLQSATAQSDFKQNIMIIQHVNQDYFYQPSLLLLIPTNLISATGAGISGSGCILVGCSSSQKVPVKTFVVEKVGFHMSTNLYLLAHFLDHFYCFWISKGC